MIPVLFCITCVAGFAWWMACPPGKELPGWLLIAFCLGIAVTMAILGR